jgi:hypothetical protein
MSKVILYIQVLISKKDNFYYIKTLKIWDILNSINKPKTLTFLIIILLNMKQKCFWYRIRVSNFYPY